MKNLLVIAPRFPSINQPWIDTYLEELLRSGITLGICSSLKEPQPYQQKVDHLKLKDKIIPYNDQFSLMKILMLPSNDGSLKNSKPCAIFNNTEDETFLVKLLSY